MSRTTRADIERWISRGQRQGAAFMLVVCDTFDHEDYPVYAETAEDAWAKYDEYDEEDMQRIMEEYDIRPDADLLYQVSLPRAHSLPPRPETT